MVSSQQTLSPWIPGSVCLSSETDVTYAMLQGTMGVLIKADNEQPSNKIKRCDDLTLVKGVAEFSEQGRKRSGIRQARRQKERQTTKHDWKAAQDTKQLRTTDLVALHSSQPDPRRRRSFLLHV